MKTPAVEPKGRPNRLGLVGWVYAGNYGIERYLYILQRITGLGILLYLPMHILVTGQKLEQQSWDSVMGLVSRGVLPLGEFAVFIGVVFHMLNGIRLLLTEFGFLLTKPSRPVYPFTLAALRQRPVVYLVLLATAVIVTYGAWEFLFL